MPLEPAASATLSGNVHVETLTTLDELEALRPAWARLWTDDPRSTPFQSPEWLLAWARRWSPRSLHVLAIRQESALVGLAPFFIYCPSASRGRTLVLLGNGISDTLDILAAPEHGQLAANALLASLDSHQHAWDACDWQQLRADSPLLSHPAPSGWSEETKPQDPCPLLALPDGQPIESVLSAHFAGRLQSDRARLEKRGALRFERATAETLDDHFDSLFALHAARWSTREEPGVLADPDIQSFHREVAAGLLARGILRVYRLHVGDRVAAVYYGFQHHARASYYLGGFDPTLSAFGVGNQMVWHALDVAREEGARVFDFLRGREAYKYRWGAVDVPAFRRRLAHTRFDR